MFSLKEEQVHVIYRAEGCRVTILFHRAQNFVAARDFKREHSKNWNYKIFDMKLQ